jgi:8-oxo-dGTP diphosphatase
MDEVLQFGEPTGEYMRRPGGYAIITNAKGEILAANVKGKYHLPGGGIDEGESTLETVIREVIEETGYRINEPTLVGKANQFLPVASLGPMNKLGTFYLASIDETTPVEPSEQDHVATWIPVQTFLDSTADEYQKWAVRKALNP